MSVQLIVYPQSFNGVFNAISGSSTELIVNGINFAGIDNTLTYETNSATPYLDVITNKFPFVINTWYRYRSNIIGTPAYPISNGPNVVLDSLGNGSTEPTGIYQRIGPLVIGATYNITLKVATGGQAANGSFLFKIFDFQTPQGNVSTFNTAAATTISKNFTATFSNMTIMCNFYSTAAEDFTIENISVQPISGQTSGTPIVESGEVLLDLYEDENLPLTLSVDDFKNVAEKVQSYSKAFKIPETKRNKRIFNQIFEVTREYDGYIFNPYRRTQCVLKQDGFTLFKGFLRLLEVVEKDKEVSYNINLYSEVIALADYLKDLSFRDLDFTELQHYYNKINIKNSWNDGTAGQTTSIIWDNANTSGFRTNFNTLKYPFVNWNNNWIIAAAGGSATANNPELTQLEQAFRPFINVKYLIDRIFEPTPFTYQSTFFNTTEFENLYMDFNWGSDNNPVTASGINSGGQPSFASIGTTFTNMPLQNQGGTTLPIGWSQATNQLISSLANEGYSVNYTLSYSGVSGDTINRQWVHRDSSGQALNIFDASTLTLPSGVTTYAYVGSFSVVLQPTDTLQLEVKTTDITGSSFQFAGSGTITFAGYFVSITSSLILQTLRGETGQWDFLKGFIDMFNLVTLVDDDNPNNILIEPYSDVFVPTATTGATLANRGIEHDWTDKIDVSEIKLKPLTDLDKKTIFKFVEDDDDFAFTNYKNLVGGHLYGSKKYDAGIEFNILDQENEIEASPFQRQ